MREGVRKTRPVSVAPTGKRPPLRARLLPTAGWAAGFVLALAAAVGTAPSGLIVLLIVDVVVLPLGLLAGIGLLALRTVVRREARRTARTAGPVAEAALTPSLGRALRFEAPAQRFNLIVHGWILAGLLVLGIAVPVMWAGGTWDVPPFLVLGGDAVLLSLLVPFSAVATGRLAFARDVVTAEAQALEFGLGAVRMIRFSRALNAVALSVAMALVGGRPAGLGAAPPARRLTAHAHPLDPRRGRRPGAPARIGA